MVKLFHVQSERDILHESSSLNQFKKRHGFDVHFHVVSMLVYVFVYAFVSQAYGILLSHAAFYFVLRKLIPSSSPS